MLAQELFREYSLAMLNCLYQSPESITIGELISLDDCVERLAFSDKSLLPIATQCLQSKNILIAHPQSTLWRVKPVVISNSW